MVHRDSDLEVDGLGGFWFREMYGLEKSMV